MEHDQEPTLRDLIELLRRGLLLAVAAAVVAGVATYLISRWLTPTYEAQATVVTSSQDPNQRSFGTTLVTAPPLDIASYRAAVASRPVLADAWRRVVGAAPTDAELDALQRSLTVRSEGTNVSSLLRLLVRDTDPARARDLANAIALAAVAWDEQRATRSLETIVESLQAQIASIDDELAIETGQAAEALLRTRGDLALQLSSARALRSGAVGRLELLEAATDGYLKATPHRVLPPAPGTSRFSVPYFLAPGLDARFPRVTLPPELAADAPGTGADLSDQEIFDLCGRNAIKSRFRAHPETTARYHAELAASLA